MQTPMGVSSIEKLVLCHMARISGEQLLSVWQYIRTFIFKSEWGQINLKKQYKENALPLLTEESMTIQVQLDPGAPMIPSRFSFPIFLFWFLGVCWLYSWQEGEGLSILWPQQLQAHIPLVL